jgi:hypothetical protein
MALCCIAPCILVITKILEEFATFISYYTEGGRNYFRNVGNQLPDDMITPETTNTHTFYKATGYTLCTPLLITIIIAVKAWTFRSL